MNRPVLAAILAVITLVGVACYLLFREPSPQALAKELRKTYEAKLENEDYQVWKSLPGLPKGYQDFPEEANIKELRSELARHQQAPAGAEMCVVSVVTGNPPKIDGVLDDDAWAWATPFTLGKGSTLRILCDGERLYLACDVPVWIRLSGLNKMRNWAGSNGKCPFDCS